MSESQREGTSEDAAAAKALLAEVQEVFGALKAKLQEVEATAVRLSELSTIAEAKASDITEAATFAATAKAQITDSQGVIAQKSEHIEGAKEHADKVRGELDAIKTVASQQGTETEGFRVRAQSAFDDIAKIGGQVTSQKALVDADLAATNESRDAARKAAEITKGLADKAEVVEKRVLAYENSLKELEEKSAAQLETITGLLPGATAAGLASAFDRRRNTFLRPATRWQWLFVGSLTLLVVLAATGLWSVYKADHVLTWDELARLWVARLPIAGALIWLALHSSQESALAKRLEEDYGFKAAVAASFQGFQKQMAELPAFAEKDSPLAKLCIDTLATIGSPPGRIYDKHRLFVSPAREAADAAKEVAGAAKEVASAAKDAVAK